MAGVRAGGACSMCGQRIPAKGHDWSSENATLRKERAELADQVAALTKRLEPLERADQEREQHGRELAAILADKSYADLFRTEAWIKAGARWNGEDYEIPETGWPEGVDAEEYIATANGMVRERWIPRPPEPKPGDAPETLIGRLLAGGKE